MGDTEIQHQRHRARREKSSLLVIKTVFFVKLAIFFPREGAFWKSKKFAIDDHMHMQANRQRSNKNHC
jgi:hypothetical protein